jgi:hypothetical protein
VMIWVYVKIPFGFQSFFSLVFISFCFYCDICIIISFVLNLWRLGIYGLFPVEVLTAGVC